MPSTTMLEVVTREIISTVKNCSVIQMLEGHRGLEQLTPGEFTFELHGCKFKVAVTEVEVEPRVAC